MTRPKLELLSLRSLLAKRQNSDSEHKKWPPGFWYKLRKRFPGCEELVVVAILLGILVLGCNIAFLGWTVNNAPRNKTTGLGIVATTDCKEAQLLNQGAHALINVLSTILTSQSNYCMQLLASPTREAVNKAHLRRQWVDIGIPSFRNIWLHHIPGVQIFFWVLLVLSSVPLHLLWNSILVVSPIAYQYNQLAVTEDFVNGGPIRSIYVHMSDADEEGAHWPDNLRILQEELHSYEYLDNVNCRREYAQSFVQKRGDVLTVVKEREDQAIYNKPNALGGAIGGRGAWSYRWMCPAEISSTFGCYDFAMQSSANWTFPNHGRPEVQYCLSKKMPELCKLEYGFWPLVLTCAANGVKIFCFCWTLRILKVNSRKREGSASKSHDNMLLITTGDAIASFLAVPDPQTVGMSIVEKKDFEHGIWDLRWVHISPMPWRQRERCSSFRAIGVKRWLIDIILISLLVLIPGFFLLHQMQGLGKKYKMSSAAIWELGMGKPSGLLLLGSKAAPQHITVGKVVQDIMIANTPQLVLSATYFWWNSHITAMIAAQEYDRFAAPKIKNAEDANSISEEEQRSDDDNSRERESGELRARDSSTSNSNEDTGLETSKTKRRSLFEAISKPFRKIQSHFNDKYHSYRARKEPKKRGLRVSIPREGTDQRSTRFLTLPFRYWLPSAILWAVLHWLASQAMFFARVDVLDHWLQPTVESISQVGYSILGIIMFVSVASLTLTFALLTSWRKLENNMPLAATCSGALSAACHPKDVAKLHHEKEVYWGIEQDSSAEAEAAGGGDTIKYCTFTSEVAYYPDEDVVYA